MIVTCQADWYHSYPLDRLSQATPLHQEPQQWQPQRCHGGPAMCALFGTALLLLPLLLLTPEAQVRQRVLGLQPWSSKADNRQCMAWSTVGLSEGSQGCNTQHERMQVTDI
jgi:hypothetical protein